jgi:hypothetical protein
MISGFRDILSPVKLMWIKSDFGFIDWQTFDLGDINSLWHDDYDPQDESNSINGTKTPGILHDSVSFVEGEAGQKMLKLWSEQDFPAWQLRPELIESAGEQGKWGISFAKTVVSKILSLLSLRRILRTPLKLPDEQITYPALELPPIEILTEELLFDAKTAKTVKDHGESMAQSLVRQSPNGDLTDYTGRTTNLEAALSGDGGQINFGSYREVVLGAHDARNIRLLKQNATKFFEPDKQKATTALRVLRDCNLEKTTTKVKIAKTITQPIIGVKHVKQIAGHTVYSGLDFFYSQTRADNHIPTLVGPHQWSRWGCGGSPITTRMLHLCHK